jgi:hypothetical protein
MNVVETPYPFNRLGSLLKRTFLRGHIMLRKAYITYNESLNYVCAGYISRVSCQNAIFIEYFTILLYLSF